MNHQALVGMHFLFDNTGERYRTGVIADLISGGESTYPYYLLKFDPINNRPLPMGVVGINELTFIGEETGMRDFSLFYTREELDAWVKWIESPPEEDNGEKVVSLVKTGKGNLKRKEVVIEEEED